MNHFDHLEDMKKRRAELLALDNPTEVQRNAIQSLDEGIARYDEVIICCECGQKDYPGMTMNGDTLRARQMCFNCSFWADKIEIRDDPTVARASGHHYIIGGENEREKGTGGARFRFRFFDGREVITTNRWCQGWIPLHFRDRLPDNAEMEALPR